MKLSSGLTKASSGCLAHLAGTEEECSTALEVSKDLLGKLAGDGADAHGAFRDSGFVPDALGRGEGLRRSRPRRRYSKGAMPGWSR